MYQVLLAPLVSEKTTRAGERENSVAFWVKPDATKPEVKQAVEALFNVKVSRVNTSSIGSRLVRSGGRLRRSKNKKKAYVKKAYVMLEPGHQITFANDHLGE